MRRRGATGDWGEETRRKFSCPNVVKRKIVKWNILRQQKNVRQTSISMIYGFLFSLTVLSLRTFFLLLCSWNHSSFSAVMLNFFPLSRQTMRCFRLRNKKNSAFYEKRDPMIRIILFSFFEVHLIYLWPWKIFTMVRETMAEAGNWKNIHSSVDVKKRARWVRWTIFR